MCICVCLCVAVPVSSRYHVMNQSNGQKNNLHSKCFDRSCMVLALDLHLLCSTTLTFVYSNESQQSWEVLLDVSDKKARLQALSGKQSEGGRSRMRKDPIVAKELRVQQHPDTGILLKKDSIVQRKHAYWHRKWQWWERGVGGLTLVWSSNDWHLWLVHVCRDWYITRQILKGKNSRRCENGPGCLPSFLFFHSSAKLFVTYETKCNFANAYKERLPECALSPFVQFRV